MNLFDRENVVPLIVVIVVAGVCFAGDTIPEPVTDEAIARELVSDLVHDSAISTPVLSHGESQCECKVGGSCVVTLENGSLWFMVDVDARRVVGFNSTQSRIPTKTSDGRLVDQAIFRDELVHFQESEAKEEAHSFASRLYGPRIDKELALFRTGSRVSGNGFYYSFMWSNVPNIDGFRMGSTAIVVHVNPIDGSISDAVFSEILPASVPMRAFDDVVRIAESELVSLGDLACFELKDAAFVPENRDDNCKVHYWKLSYVDLCPAENSQSISNRSLTVSVADETGETALRLD